jgi:enoyl-CoA hydratase
MSERPRVHDHLVEDRRDQVAVLRVDREAALGALSRSMVEALGAYLEDLARDGDVRVLVLTGTGRGFIAGADVGEYHRRAQEEFDAYQRLSRGVFDLLAGLPQATIAAVNGYALGGGFEVVLCCDLVVASAEARFGLPEVKLGLVPGGGGTVRLPRAVGPRLAKDLLMTGRSMPADEAERHGLVARVTAPQDLLDDAVTLAERIAGRAPLAVREGKRLVDGGLDRDIASALDEEQRCLSRLFATADATEGIAAFLAKREAVFRGR